jgi:hypothetical protein
VRALATRYLAFVHAAFDPAQARFRNFMTYGRAWAEPLGSEDSHGHAVQALGTVIGRAPARRRAGERAVPRRPPGHDRLHQPARVGHDAARHRRLPHAYEGDRGSRTCAAHLADRLHDVYARTQTAEWPWFEAD